MNVENKTTNCALYTKANGVLNIDTSANKD